MFILETLLWAWLSTFIACLVIAAVTNNQETAEFVISIGALFPIVFTYNVYRVTRLFLGCIFKILKNWKSYVKKATLF